MASIELSRYEAEEGDLPDVCMCCGAPATDRKRRRFTSHPVWVYLLLPFGLLPYVIVAAVLTESARCYVLFCPQYKNHWLRRTLLVWGSFVALIAVLFGSLVFVGLMQGQLDKSTSDVLSGSLCVGSLFLVLFWLISIPIVQMTAIQPTNVTQHRLTLRGISPAFVDAVREHRAKRRNEEDQEDFRRQFRPSHSDSIREGED
jgi:hypothetical protein